MNSNETLKLNDMIKEGDCVDNTEMIRQLKHSSQITKNLNIILRLKKKHEEMEHILGSPKTSKNEDAHVYPYCAVPWS